MSEIRKLYEWLGDELTADTVGRMLAWRSDNPADKFGKHTFDAAQFGITDETLATHFGSYAERFGSLL